MSLAYSMSVRLLTEHHLRFLSLTGGCTSSSESTLVKIPKCWKSHVAAQIYKDRAMAFSLILQTVGDVIKFWDT